MITGSTKLIAHLGYPTESFKAPMIYNPFFEKNGIDVVVVPMGCRADDYSAFLPLVSALSNFHGALVTMPHKVTTVGLLDDATPAIKIAGSCNAVKRARDGRLVGDMFDGEGFVRGVERKGRQLRGVRALIVGTGGVGSAIAASLARAEVAELGLYDTAPAMADRLAARLRRHYPEIALNVGTNDPAGWDIVVNATPLGMTAGDPMPVEITRIDPSAFVGDVVLTHEVTPFLGEARARGCEIQIGIDMLFEQIPAYLEFFDLPTTTPDELRALARLGYGT